MHESTNSDSSFMLLPSRSTRTALRRIGTYCVCLTVCVMAYILWPRPWPRGAWDAADHNRDGLLSRAEMEQFSTQQPHRNGPRLMMHFEAADQNHDGFVDAQEVDRYGTRIGSKDPLDHLPPPSHYTAAIGLK